MLYKSNIKCGWNGCENRTCLNAPKLADSSYTHNKCFAYLSGCTVNADKSGCVTQMSTCLGLDSNQCGLVVLTNGSTCIWATNDATPSCRLSQCSDVP